LIVYFGIGVANARENGNALQARTRKKGHALKSPGKEEHAASEHQYMINEV